MPNITDTLRGKWFGVPAWMVIGGGGLGVGLLLIAMRGRQTTTDTGQLGPRLDNIMIALTNIWGALQQTPEPTPAEPIPLDNLPLDPPIDPSEPPPAPRPKPPPAPSPAPRPAPPPAPPPAPRPAPPPAPSPTTYTVKPGDSVGAIALMFKNVWPTDLSLWGRLGAARQLYNANKNVIGPDWNLIRPGQVLTIPWGQGLPVAVTSGIIGGAIPTIWDMWKDFRDQRIKRRTPAVGQGVPVGQRERCLDVGVGTIELGFDSVLNTDL